MDDSRRPRQFALALSLFALMAGILSLVGWLTQTRRLTDWLNSGIHIFPNTALAASCLGAGLGWALLMRGRMPLVTGFLGFAAFAIGAATLCEHIFNVDLGIDMLLVTTDAWGFRAAAAPGRPGLPASISFVLLGIAVMATSGNGRFRRVAPLMGSLVMGLSSLAIIGYLFNADPLFSISRFSGIALPTAVILFATGAAVLASNPELEPVRTICQRSAAGVLTRSVLPFVVVIPTVLGWIFIASRGHGWVDRGMGVALLVLLLIMFLCVLLWRSVVAVAAHERVSQNREARFRSYFELGLIGMVITSSKKEILEVNDEFCSILGYTRGELLHATWPEVTHPEDIGADVASFNRVVAGEINGYSLEKRFMRKDGRVVHTNVSVRGVRNADGTLDHFVALVEDITARKESELTLKQQARSLEIINRVGGTLSELNLDKLVQSVTDAGREISGGEIGAFFYNVEDEHGAACTLCSLSGLPRDVCALMPTPRNTAIFNSTFKGEGVLRLADVTQDPRYGKSAPHFGMPPGHQAVRSYLAVPVISRSGEVLGGLFYGHSQPGVFTEEAEKIIVAIAAQAAVAIDNARLYRKAQMEIEQRKQAAEAKARLAAIVEHSDDAIVSKDLNGVIQSWNRSAERVFGYAASEAIGRPITMLIPHERLPEEATILERMRRGESIVHFETIRRHKDGTLLDISLTVSPMRDDAGRIIGVSKIARNITERKRTERQQNALYELVATINRAAATPAIFDAAIEAVCRCFNASRAAILLCEEDRKMRFKAWRGVSEEFRAAFESVDGPAATAGGPLFLENSEATDVSDSLREALAREGIASAAFIPLAYENRLLGQFAVFYPAPTSFMPDSLRLAQTIASQVVFAIERQRSGEALEELVNQRTASLREVIAQMEEFSYTVSHDLRAPLRGMKVYSETLLEEHAALLPAEATHHLQRIAINADRLDKMILDVLTFTRIARAEIQLERVALDRLVRQIVEQYPGMQPPEAHIEIEPLPDVLGHEPSLTQALSNLLNNAVKFVAPNVRPEVHIWSERNNGHVRLWVQDNGIGIPPKYQRRLFSMFERLHPNLKYEGTGVGLAIVRKAVERMGGRVGMESDGTTGSRFWIEVHAVDPSHVRNS